MKWSITKALLKFCTTSQLLKYFTKLQKHKALAHEKLLYQATTQYRNALETFSNEVSFTKNNLQSAFGLGLTKISRIEKQSLKTTFRYCFHHFAISTPIPLLFSRGLND